MNKLQLENEQLQVPDIITGKYFFDRKMGINMNNLTKICIHGHFYQPPRENPWLEGIEIQRSASPFSNWNERITAECYAPNTAARLLDKRGRIVRVVNNYSHISFNFGPTLLSWLEKNNIRIYEAILKADFEGSRNFSGHGPAIAQAYNHMIMPLASIKDKTTQIKWGIRDFNFRFGREPEGMWLPEAAVDIETLEVLADHGLGFTVLSPGQADKVLSEDSSRWSDVAGGKVDSEKPYICDLPSGNSITIFFYDGAVSQDVAFGKLLDNGQKMAERLISMGQYGSEPVLVSIAADGETFGHHHKYGDMALAYAVERIKESEEADLTVFGEFLSKYPPRDKVAIVENSSWSCVHGVARWKDHCGCSTGMNPSWNQAWRKHLRESLDWLRDKLAEIYEETSKGLMEDPWGARDNYIMTILRRNPENMARFLKDNLSRDLDHDGKVRIFKSLEMQYRSMLMFTSCGWFFDDISGIETLQILRYACQAMEYAYDLKGLELEDEFLMRLEKAESNINKFGNGRNIYNEHVKPFSYDFYRVAAHTAVLFLFTKDIHTIPSYCYEIKILKMVDLGKDGRIARIGKFSVISSITLEERKFSFCSLRLGGHNVLCSVSDTLSDNDSESMFNSMTRTFEHGDMSSMINIAESYFGDHFYNLSHVFRHEQKEIVKTLLRGDLEKIDAFLGDVLENDHMFMNFISAEGMPVPTEFLKSAEIVINSDLQKELAKELPDIEKIRSDIVKAESWDIDLDKAAFSSEALKWLDKKMEELKENSEDIVKMMTLRDFLLFLRDTSIQPDLWYSQNLYFEIKHIILGKSRETDIRVDSKIYDIFLQIGDLLGISV